MVIKTKNRRNVSENRKKNKKRITRKRRGGKKKRDAQWEEGFWSEEPTIHTTFKTQGKTNTPECGYSLMWNYHYLDEDDSIPLEKPLEKPKDEKPKDEKDTRIKKREILQIFTNSEATDKRNKTKLEIKMKNQKYRNCALPEKEVLQLLKDNNEFQQKVKNDQHRLKEMIEVDREQKGLMNMFENKSANANDKLKYIVGKNKEIKDIFDKKNPKK